MAILVGETKTVTIDKGDFLILTLSASDSITVELLGVRAGEVIQSSTDYSASDVVLGGYDNPASFKIICTAGSVTYERKAPSPAPVCYTFFEATSATAQRNALGFTSIGGLTTTEIANLDSAQVAALVLRTTTQIAAIGSAQVSAIVNMTTTQVNYLATAQAASFVTMTTTQVAALGTAQLASVAGFTTTQVASLGSALSAAPVWSALMALTTTQISGI